MSIFEFSNYRDFLRAYTKSLPKGGHGELTRIAKHLRISTTLLSQILSGVRSFNSDQAFELSEYLQLTEVEMDYFYLLVEIEKASSHKNKNHLRKKLAKVKEEALKISKRIRHDRTLSDVERAVFYSSWLYPSVHLYAGIKKTGATLEEVCERFSLPRPKAAEILQFLLQSGLCIEEHGKFTSTAQSTFVETGSPHLLRHHANWRVKAIEKSETILAEELMFTAPLSISKKDFAMVREKAAQFIKSVSEIVKNTEPDEIAHFNLDWFWIK